MKKYLNLITIIISILLLTQCKDNSHAVDPCVGAKRTTADFTISEMNYWDITRTIIPSDTILHDNIGLFKAVDTTADTYNWLIGDDTTIHRTAYFPLRFGIPEAYGKIQVRLIVTKKPNLNCFPDDKSIDTVIKYVTVIPDSSAAIYGKYYGCNQDNPSDSFVVNIFYLWDKYHVSYYTYINNINKGCNDSIYTDFEYDPYFESPNFFKGITFDCSNSVGYGCLQPKGTGILQDDLKTIVINYSIVPDETKTTRVQKQFIGRRIK